MHYNSLKSIATKGIIWSAIDKFAIQFGQFIVGIVLARILVPEDFGLIGMLAIFIALSQTFVESGMGMGLIQRQDRSALDFSTLFVCNLVVSGFFYFLLFFSAPFIATFFKQPQLTDLTRILGLNLILNALAIVQRTKLTIAIDFEVIAKSKGNEVIDGISAMAKHYGVSNNHIVYDADGVGAFVEGFIPGAIPFHGGGAVIETRDHVSGKLIKENYHNLRTQCYYRSGLRCDRGDMKINAMVQNKMYDNKMTVRQRLLYERKAIKKDAKTPDGKLKIISKDEMKAKLNGDSPDLFDMLMMRELAELKPKRQYIG